MGDDELVLSLNVFTTPIHLRWRVHMDVVIPSETPAEAAQAVLGALNEIL